jgi:hypothetical protein
MEEMKNFYFQRSNGEYILLQNNCTEAQALMKMNEFLEEHNFKSYYTRCWKTPDGNTHYDCGSWSEFFVWGFVEHS